MASRPEGRGKKLGRKILAAIIRNCPFAAMASRMLGSVGKGLPPLTSAESSSSTASPHGCGRMISRGRSRDVLSASPPASVVNPAARGRLNTASSCASPDDTTFLRAQSERPKLPLLDSRAAWKVRPSFALSTRRTPPSTAQQQLQSHALNLTRCLDQVLGGRFQEAELARDELAAARHGLQEDSSSQGQMSSPGRTSDFFPWSSRAAAPATRRFPRKCEEAFCAAAPYRSPRQVERDVLPYRSPRIDRKFTDTLKKYEITEQTYPRLDHRIGHTASTARPQTSSKKTRLPNRPTPVYTTGASDEIDPTSYACASPPGLLSALSTGVPRS